MSHELRTPLNSIIGFAQILQDTTSGPLLAKQARFVDNIHRSGQYLLTLINDLLEAPVTKRNQGTTGLGLALTKQLVELHGGTIWAESDGEGRGSTFTVQFPTPPSQNV